MVRFSNIMVYHTDGLRKATTCTGLSTYKFNNKIRCFNSLEEINSKFKGQLNNLIDLLSFVQIIEL